MTYNEIWVSNVVGYVNVDELTWEQRQEATRFRQWECQKMRTMDRLKKMKKSLNGRWIPK